MAHYIWYGKGLWLEDEYKMIYNNTDEWVSNYSKTDASEDFAETFEKSYVCYINYSAIPKDRRQYFKNNVEKFI